VSGDTPQVSVIIAAWCAERTLPHAVASALGQTGVRVEVIVVDDASGDDTFACAQSLAEDPRVRAFRQSTNAGPAAARNLAMSHARAPWVAVLDADDLMRPDRLSGMLALARTAQADVVLGNLTEVTGRSDSIESARTGPVFLTTPDQPVRWDLPSYIEGNLEGGNGRTLGYLKPLLSTGFLARHKIRYDETLRNGEDFHLILSCLAVGARVWFSPAPDYLYFRHDGSVSHRANPEHMRVLATADRTFAAGQADARVRGLMHRRIRQIERLGTAETIMAALRERRAGTALGELIRQPAAFPRLVRQLGQALRKRI
jgi:succinoglycan biosynthesis protein ExoO